MKTDNKADKEENVHIPGIIFTLELYCFLITVSRFFFFRVIVRLVDRFNTVAVLKQS